MVGQDVLQPETPVNWRATDWKTIIRFVLTTRVEAVAIYHTVSTVYDT
jgi:hypothetical protein